MAAEVDSQVSVGVEGVANDQKSLAWKLQDVFILLHDRHVSMKEEEFMRCHLSDPEKLMGFMKTHEQLGVILGSSLRDATQKPFQQPGNTNTVGTHGDTVSRYLKKRLNSETRVPELRSVCSLRRKHKQTEE
ncbi:hypothetical protein GOODEAATRI_010576 [Goodea atripinnis]|uniref:Uncharacterized protein n=1 Tax=Goodea atripinnis TaxID=208336 RepID=A0ABV0PWW6_9TELE